MVDGSVLSSRVRGRAPAGLASLLLALIVALVAAASAPAQGTEPKVLVFHKTSGTPHASTADGVTAIKAIGDANGYTVDDTATTADFTAEGLADYAAVVFLNTNGDVLTTDEESAFRAYIEGGGGFVGIHDAARVETGSSWFTGLIGSRPNAQSPTAVQDAVVEVQDKVHPAGRGLPTEWQRSDEWFNWSPSPAGNVQVVANLRERSYGDLGTGANGWEHPISWCRDYEGGRSFYTGMGHTAGSYGEADFRKHLDGAIKWAAGLIRGNCKATIDSSYTAERLTQPNAFQGNTPESQLDQIGEPHGLSIAPDGRVFYIGRADKGTSSPIDSWSDPDGFRGWGTVHVWDPSKPAAQRVKLVGTLDVFGDSVGGSELQKKEEGLIGIVLDPNFEQNHYIYLHYTPYELVNKTTHVATRRVARFTYDEATAKLDLASEKPIIEWTYQAHSCCHMGGDMDFDKDGNLYILTGDTNSSGSTGGYSGNFVGNEFMGLSFNDARRTSGNTNDLNGKIIRIKPLADPGATPGLGSTYTVPAGNLFGPGGKYPDADPAKVRREIYVMGVRNPTRLWIDPDKGWVMTGWVGPDAGSPSAQLGPAKYESLAAIPEAGNYGWPYCMGNKQPYRDRDDTAGSNAPTGWYSCDAPVNDSPYNTGLTNLPPAESLNMWYSPQGGGPVHPPLAGENRPDYGAAPTITQPYLPGGGGQATMPGPLYRYDAESGSATKFPEFWDGKWFLGDHSRGSLLRAVGLDDDTVANHKAPKTAVDTSGIVGKTGAQVMGMDFGPDGNLYVLDYGGGFFTVTSRSSLWRVRYTGGPATPAASPTGVPIGDYQVRFLKGGSGGVSYLWEFGDGETSTQPNPVHTYAEAKQYTAKLTVTYADGGTDSKTVAVDVLAEPDETAPVTTATLDPAEPNEPDETYSRPVTLTLTATDEGGSGVDKIEYRIGEGEWQTYTGPVTRSQPGDYVIYYRATDVTGNVEDMGSVEFTITVVQNCPTNLNDEFGGPTLDTKWEIRNDVPAARSFVDGRLRMLVRNGDLYQANASAKNVLLQPAPEGSWEITTKLDVSTLSNEGEQAGIVLFSSAGANAADNTFAKIMYIDKGAQNRFEWVATRQGGASINAGPQFDGNPGEVFLRVSANGSGTYVAYSSLDGETWTPIQGPITNLGDPETLKFGVKISDNADTENYAGFDYFRVDCSDRIAPTSTATVSPEQPDGQLGWYTTEPTVTLEADDGEFGSEGKIEYSIDGGELQLYDGPFTVEGAGEHVVEYFATDGAEEPNAEEPKTLGLRIDGSAPTTGANVEPTGAADTMQVTLDPQDGADGSGSVLTQYRVDGGPWKTYASADEQIFDGSAASLQQWRQAPSGRFDLMQDGSGGITPVGGLGMLWYPVKAYGDFRLKLEFREGRTDGGHSNGGVFVRFPDARVPLDERTDQCARTGNAATSEAWVAIFCGHEIQLYDGETGEPRKTGSIYTFQNNGIDDIGPAEEIGEWEDYEIEVVGQTYRIYRNGVLINEYENSPDKVSDRGGDPPASLRQFAEGYIGLQNHGGADTMQYRNIRVEDLSEDAPGQDPTGAFEVSGAGPHTIEYRSVDAAGNREAKQTLAFEIGEKVPPGSTGGSGQDPDPVPGDLPPMIDTPASYELGDLASRIRAKRFAKKGLKVRVACTGAMTGEVKLTVSRKDARKLKLRKRTLDTADVRCFGAHTATVKLKPSKSERKKLNRWRKSDRGGRKVKLRLSVTMADLGQPAKTVKDTVKLRKK